MLFALSFVIIAGMAGLVIDMGRVYNTKSRLKKVTNAAVLSGVQELVNNDTAVNNVVNDILRFHKEENSVKTISIKPDGQSKLKVTLEKDVPLTFLKLFNMNSLKVKESSTAGLIPTSRADGAVPLGVDESIPLEYLKEYTLKVDSGDSEYGNFGILALSGPGAHLYEDDLRYGYDGEIKVGQVIPTETGNVSGKTQSAVNYRINSSPYLVDDISHRDDPRIMLVLVYRPYDIQSNQMKSVKITGFAYFYIKSPMNINDSSITGYFIKRAGAGYGDASIQDKGAYSIRLVE